MKVLNDLKVTKNAPDHLITGATFTSCSCFRRARTSQNVSIQWVTAERLKMGVHKLKHTRGVFVGNFSYKNEGLELGDLVGNHFAIALRNIKPEEKYTVSKALDALKDRGFINYFGLQRFGTVASIKTSDIGLAMIKSNWSEAVELLLKPRPNEDKTFSRARAFWWMYRDPAATLRILNEMNDHGSLEKILLQGKSGMTFGDQD